MQFFVHARIPPPRASRIARIAALGLALAAGFPSAARPQSGADDARRWIAGAYTFSDELGGFTIDGVGGVGTKADPIVIRETFNSSSAATLVIRTRRPIRPFDAGDYYANGILYMRILTRNGSGQGWVQFELELQEQLREPSIFGDGLSFDQRNAGKENIASDAFRQFSRDFEPYDKLLFRDGKVDPGGEAGFSFLITDYTPKNQFYLVQDPRIPSS